MFVYIVASHFHHGLNEELLSSVRGLNVDICIQGKRIHDIVTTR